MSRQNILCHDRVWPNGEVLCCDASLGRFSIATEYFYVATEVAKARRNYVVREQFYVATELARVGRISFTIEGF